MSDKPENLIGPYKGLKGKVSVIVDERIMHGSIIGIRDLVLFQGIDFDDLQVGFEDAINSYLADCKELNRKPK